MLTAPWLDVGTLSWRSCGQSWGAVGSPHLCPCLLGGLERLGTPSVMLGQTPLGHPPEAQTLLQEAPCLGSEPALGGCACPHRAALHRVPGVIGGLTSEGGPFPEGMGGSCVYPALGPRPTVVPCGSEHPWVFVHPPRPLASSLAVLPGSAEAGRGAEACPALAELGAAWCHSGRGSSALWGLRGAWGPAAPSMVWGAHLCPRMPGVDSGAVCPGVACGQGQAWLFWKQPGQHWPWL